MTRDKDRPPFFRGLYSMDRSPEELEKRLRELEEELARIKRQISSSRDTSSPGRGTMLYDGTVPSLELVPLERLTHGDEAHFDDFEAGGVGFETDAGASEGAVLEKDGVFEKAPTPVPVTPVDSLQDDALELDFELEPADPVWADILGFDIPQNLDRDTVPTESVDVQIPEIIEENEKLPTKEDSVDSGGARKERELRPDPAHRWEHVPFTERPTEMYQEPELDDDVAPPEPDSLLERRTSLLEEPDVDDDSLVTPQPVSQEQDDSGGNEGPGEHGPQYRPTEMFQGDLPEFPHKPGWRDENARVTRKRRISAAHNTQLFEPVPPSPPDEPDNGAPDPIVEVDTGSDQEIEAALQKIEQDLMEWESQGLGGAAKRSDRTPDPRATMLYDWDQEPARGSEGDTAIAPNPFLEEGMDIDSQTSGHEMAADAPEVMADGSRGTMDQEFLDPFDETTQVERVERVDEDDLVSVDELPDEEDVHHFIEAMTPGPVFSDRDNSGVAETGSDDAVLQDEVTRQMDMAAIVDQAVDSLLEKGVRSGDEEGVSENVSHDQGATVIQAEQDAGEKDVSLDEGGESDPWETSELEDEWFSGRGTGAGSPALDVSQEESREETKEPESEILEQNQVVTHDNISGDHHEPDQEPHLDTVDVEEPEDVAPGSESHDQEDVPEPEVSGSIEEPETARSEVLAQDDGTGDPVPSDDGDSEILEQNQAVTEEEGPGPEPAAEQEGAPEEAGAEDSAEITPFEQEWFDAGDEEYGTFDDEAGHEKHVSHEEQVFSQEDESTESPETAAESAHDSADMEASQTGTGVNGTGDDMLAENQDSQEQGIEESGEPEPASKEFQESQEESASEEDQETVREEGSRDAEVEDEPTESPETAAESGPDVMEDSAPEEPVPDVDGSEDSGDAGDPLSPSPDVDEPEDAEGIEALADSMSEPAAEESDPWDSGQEDEGGEPGGEPDDAAEPSTAEDVVEDEPFPAGEEAIDEAQEERPSEGKDEKQSATAMVPPPPPPDPHIGRRHTWAMWLGGAVLFMISSTLMGFTIAMFLMEKPAQPGSVQKEEGRKDTKGAVVAEKEATRDATSQKDAVAQNRAGKDREKPEQAPKKPKEPEKPKVVMRPIDWSKYAPKRMALMEVPPPDYDEGVKAAMATDDATENFKVVMSPEEVKTGNRILRNLLTAPQPVEPGCPRCVREANRLMDRGRYRRAARLYLRSLNIRPEDNETRVKLAFAYHMLKQDRRALAEVSKVLATDPMHPMALLIAGTTHQMRGEYARAIRFYTQYLKQKRDTRFAEEVRVIVSYIDRVLKKKQGLSPSTPGPMTPSMPSPVPYETQPQQQGAEPPGGGTGSQPEGDPSELLLKKLL